MKKSIIFIFSGLLLATLYQSCNDCFTLGNCPPEYHFRAIDSLIRDHDTVSVGDTIWLGTSISDSLQKHPPQTGKVYFPNAEVSIKVDFKNNEGDEFANPEVVIESGNYDNWGYGSSVHFEHKNNRYYHKVGLILNKSGVYYIN